MASVLKVLAQSYPSATTLTSIYTTPSLTSTVVSSIFVCNQTGNIATFRIAVSPAGATITNGHYIYYDVEIQGNDTMNLVSGITLATTDVIRVYSSILGLSFNVFGQENS